MKSWNSEWREVGRMVETHARPVTIIRQLVLMMEAYPEMDRFCPTCEVEHGPCVSKSGKISSTHKMRLDRQEAAS
jgi:hypothetical protein